MVIMKKIVFGFLLFIPILITDKVSAQSSDFYNDVYRILMTERRSSIIADCNFGRLLNRDLKVSIWDVIKDDRKQKFREWGASPKQTDIILSAYIAAMKEQCPEVW
jgi:hypothetical protein